MDGQRAAATLAVERGAWAPVAGYGWREGDRTAWQSVESPGAGSPASPWSAPLPDLAPGRRWERPWGAGLLRAVSVGPRLNLAVLLGPRGGVPPWGQQRALAALWQRRLRVVPQVTRPPEAPPSASLVHPLRAAADVVEARSRLYAHLLQAGVEPERALRACVAAAEAMINAVRHGGGGEVRAWLDCGRAWVRVVDGGPGLAFPRLAEALLRPRPEPGCGHGYWLILGYAHGCRVDVGAWGTCVTVAFAGPRRRPASRAARSPARGGA